MGWVGLGWVGSGWVEFFYILMGWIGLGQKVGNICKILCCAQSLNVGLGWVGSCLRLSMWVGSGWVKQVVGWVGSGQDNLTHGHL